MHLKTLCCSPRLAWAFYCTAAVLCCVQVATAAAVPVPATATATAPAPAPAPSSDLNFDQTFNARDEPRQLHYRARYTLDGKPHAVEAWRDRDRRLKRRTDARIETLVVKPAADTDWHMTVLDLDHKIRTDIDRTNLLRIGHFTDWFGLAHALTRPAGAYHLTRLTTAPDVPPAIAQCHWYGLKQNGVDSRICWSNVLHLPLLIVDAHDQLQWQVVTVDAKPLPEATFAINDAGFVHNNANEDIKSD